MKAPDQPPVENGDDDARGLRDRAAFQRLLDERGVSPAELARMAGYARPNLIYNFLNGHTSHFSAETVKKLAKALDVPVAQIMGIDPPPGRRGDPGGLTIKTVAEIGVWRDSFDLPIEEQFRAPVTVDQEMRNMGAFGVLVRGRGIELVYPEDTILVAVPLDTWDGNLLPGRKIILQRIRDRVEVSVRELEVSDSRAYLWPRSNNKDPDCLVPVEMPWPHPSRAWKRGEDRFLIAGVVVQSTRPE